MFFSDLDELWFFAFGYEAETVLLDIRGKIAEKSHSTALLFARGEFHALYTPLGLDVGAAELLSKAEQIYSRMSLGLGRQA